MSVFSFLRGFRESVSAKKSGKTQIREAPRPGSAVADSEVWTVPSTATATAEPPQAGSTAGIQAMPSFFPGAEPTEVKYLADIPGEMRDRIQQEGLARIFRRLETPLRALNTATSRKGVNYPADELRGFLLMWRQALNDYVGLVPDERSVLVYDRSVDEAYFVRGRCQVGAHLTVIEPCWMLKGEVVVRGEAQVVQGWVR